MLSIVIPIPALLDSLLGTHPREQQLALCLYHKKRICVSTIGFAAESDCSLLEGDCRKAMLVLERFPDPIESYFDLAT
jgi:hypothetical protein